MCQGAAGGSGLCVTGSAACPSPEIAAHHHSSCEGTSAASAFEAGGDGSGGARPPAHPPRRRSSKFLRSTAPNWVAALALRSLRGRPISQSLRRCDARTGPGNWLEGHLISVRSGLRASCAVRLSRQRRRGARGSGSVPILQCNDGKVASNGPLRTAAAGRPGGRGWERRGCRSHRPASAGRQPWQS